MIFYPGRSELININPRIQIEKPRGESSLYSSLISFWKLNELSGNRADSIGNNTLVDNNTVGNSTGLVYANCADLVPANNEFLDVASNAGLVTGDVTFWCGLWVKRNSNTTGHVIGKGWNTPNTREWVLYHESVTQKVAFYVGYGGVAQSTQNIAQSGTLANSTWYFLLFWHDSVGNTINIQVNNGTVASVAHSNGLNTSTSDFVIGSDWGGTIWNGQVGPVMFGKNYVPTVADRTFLYNSGVGMTWEAMRAY